MHESITPLPCPDGASIVFVGGTFDPPHRAHVELPLQARERSIPAPDRDETWLIYVPAACSPHKSTGPEASDAERIRWLHWMLANEDRCAVWTDEIDRARASVPSYWSDTLTRARIASPSSAFRFIIGTDQAGAFHRWHEYRAILQEAAPIVLPRGDVLDAASLGKALSETQAWTSDEIDQWIAWLAQGLTGDYADLSATGLREVLSTDPNDTRLSEWLHPLVLEDITASQRYRSVPESD